ncbi:hypothetical protein [Geomesophilobacter sediminis]|uniref:Uncharacterized protein n=1 Tax=Geomesophilobacter sediminis TaxID=2798584 RepID=A0A8J7M0D4_9BACT|nr:hypothetical protein [Geomesophilobacter sediminis]MBJ6724602.1 hypothetical protein [Geomesophilobacter sediminis]
MKKNILALGGILVGSLITATPVLAGPATDALITCMTDNTTGKDRKDMARWVFAGMSVHPTIESLSNVTDKDRDQFDKELARMVTRLLTENCKAEAKEALGKEAGEAPLKAAFSVMGKLAMQELLNDPKVQATFTSFAKYLDEDKFKVFNPD